MGIGDRACLALALERRAKVYTNDLAWTRIGLGEVVAILMRGHEFRRRTRSGRIGALADHKPVALE